MEAGTISASNADTRLRAGGRRMALPRSVGRLAAAVSPSVHRARPIVAKQIHKGGCAGADHWIVAWQPGVPDHHSCGRLAAGGTFPKYRIRISIGRWTPAMVHPRAV